MGLRYDKVNDMITFRYVLSQTRLNPNTFFKNALCVYVLLPLKY